MIDTCEVKLGQVVIACAGRDKGRALVVVKIVDTQYVLVADGDLRRMEQPKLKKVKHIKRTHTVIDEIALLLTEQKIPLNADLRKALNDFTFKAE